MMLSLSLPSQSKHHVLKAPHPSPITGGFVGCGHFADTNQLLQQQANTLINWTDLLCFHLHRVALTSDDSKMYQAVLLHPADHDSLFHSF